MCQLCTAAITLELMTNPLTGHYLQKSSYCGVRCDTRNCTTGALTLPPVSLCFPHASRPQHSSVTRQSLFHPFFLGSRVTSQAGRFNQLHGDFRRTQTLTEPQQTLYLTHLAASSAPPITSGNPAQAQAGRL